MPGLGSRAFGPHSKRLFTDNPTLHSEPKINLSPSLFRLRAIQVLFDDSFAYFDEMRSIELLSLPLQLAAFLRLLPSPSFANPLPMVFEGLDSFKEGKTKPTHWLLC